MAIDKYFLQIVYIYLVYLVLTAKFNKYDMDVFGKEST